MSLAQGLPSTLCFEALKAKQRLIREGFPTSLGLRVHRALSWLGRAERETEDPDVRFILLWVGFNSAYAAKLGTTGAERRIFKKYFDALVELDTDHRIYTAVWMRFAQEIRCLLNNKYVFSPFWSHHNGEPGFEDWPRHLGSNLRAFNEALRRRDTAKILLLMFDRLYVLRNQLVHGGATWMGAVNRDQVRDGSAVLGWLLPVFIDVMMNHPGRDWGPPFYPVVE